MQGDTPRMSWVVPPGDASRLAELETGRRTANQLLTLEREGREMKEAVAKQPKEAKDSLGAQNPFPQPQGRSRNTTQAMLEKVLEQFDKIEQRLDGLEKKLQELQPRK